MHPKMNTESKLRLSSDSQGFRPNVHEDTLASSPNTVVKAKISRGPRTGSILLLDSSLKAHPTSTSIQGLEQPANLNKVPVLGVAENQKHQTPAGSPHAITQWVGQRPHKNARTRRANVVAPVSGHDKGQSSSQCFSASDLGVQTSCVGTNRSVIASTLENNAPKVKREVESVPSSFGLSESEESGAGENKTKDKVTDSSEVTLTASQKPGSFLLAGRKSKLNTNEIGDGVRRQGRSGRDSSLSRPGVPPAREKLENLPMTKPLPSGKPASDRNKSKTGRPPSKKLKDQRALACVGPMVNGSSSDLAGESDDREELFMAANSARNANNVACCGPFWKKMEPIFASISLEDMSYLKQQLSVAEELDECLSQMVGIGCSVLAVLAHKGLPGSCGERPKDNPNQESIKIASFSRRVDKGKLDSCAPLYQRVLSALIEEDETEEFYIHGQGKNISLHYASDDSHCSSCNLIDLEPKYGDRIESEVESKENFQTQKNSSLDRISGDNNIVACNNIRNPSMPSSLHSTEQWLVDDDDSSHSDILHASEIFSNDLILPQMRDSAVPAFSSDNQYQLMSLEDRLLLELHSIGLCPETLPDLAEGDELISQDIMELKEGLYQQVGQKRRKLVEIDKALQKGIQEERRNPEKVAMDQLVEMAYRKRLACRGSSNTKGMVRKVSKQVALTFVKRTLDRCRKFEDIGSSCFSDPALQNAIFCSRLCNNDAKSTDCVGSGTASNTCNEVTNHCTEARGSGAVSSTLERHDSLSDNISKGKRREVLIDDVIGSASSRVTTTLDSTVLSGVKCKRSDRDRDQNKDNLRSNGIMGGGRSLEGIRSERKTKPKPKQKSSHVSSSRNGLHGSSNGVANASNNVDRGARSTSLSNIPNDVSKVDDFSNLRLPELDTTELGEPQDLASWLNIDEDGLHDHDFIGLDIPMDDLSKLNMLM
uniref:Uncharacterized protein LOC105112968 isoform X3 n=1 Tax=Rhizophora mucronata TaxID=61149 RepID=A0A2P2MTC5_RHIMU